MFQVAGFPNQRSQFWIFGFLILYFLQFVEKGREGMALEVLEGLSVSVEFLACRIDPFRPAQLSIRPDRLDTKRSDGEWILVGANATVGDLRKTVCEGFHEIAQFVSESSKVWVELHDDLFEMGRIPIALNVHRVRCADFNMSNLDQRTAHQTISQINIGRNAHARHRSLLVLDRHWHQVLLSMPEHGNESSFA